MNLRTWARVLIAVSFSISGLVETIGATGLVVELAPGGHWVSGIHTLAVSGPLQIVGAAVLASGRKTRWALIILGCYVFLVGVFGNLPQVFNPSVGGNALTGLLSNLAVMGGIMYWFHTEGMPNASRAEPVVPMTDAGSASTTRLVFCLAVMGGVLYWLHSGRLPGSHRVKPAVPVSIPAQALRVKLLV